MAARKKRTSFSKVTSSSNKQVRIAKDLTISQSNHDSLMSYIKDRLIFGAALREPMADRFEVIDREVAGYLILDEDDQKRKVDTDRGFGPKVTDTVLPLTFAQLDEALTFLLSVLAPDDAMYTAIAPKDKQQVASGFSSLMNKHAESFKHYSNLARFLFDGLKYNFGGIIIDWERVFGNKINNAPGGTGIKVVNQLVNQGNSLTTFDVYNTLIDPSIHPTLLALKGEFFCQIELHTPFRVRRMEANEEIFGIDRFIDEANFPQTYYREPPTVRADVESQLGNTNWLEILSGGVKKGVSDGIEFDNTTIWLNSKQFGLSDVDELQIWRVTSVHDRYIVAAELKTNAHGLLPVAITTPIDDGLGVQTKAFSELLLPYQRFASFQFNVHQRAARKALYGITIYDKQQAPLMEKADVLGGKVPVNPQSNDRDVRRSVFQFNDAPDTSNTLRDVDAVDNLMQKILPTDILKQVASLERATQYQAAATVQGANRRNLKIAKVINDQAMSNIRHIQMFNILQFQEALDIIDENGNTLTINPSEFREAELEFEIADGLRGLDKLALIEFYKDLLNSALQSQQINDNMDLVGLLNYMSSILGDKTDISQFKFKSEFDKLNPEQKNIAFQLLQQAIAQQQGAQQGAQQEGQPGGATTTPQ